MENRESYQIIINNRENPSVQIRYKEGTKYLGTQFKYISELISEDYITQEEANQVESTLRKMVDSDRLKNPISINDLNIGPVGIS